MVPDQSVAPLATPVMEPVVKHAAARREPPQERKRLRQQNSNPEPPEAAPAVRPVATPMVTRMVENVQDIRNQQTIEQLDKHGRDLPIVGHLACRGDGQVSDGTTVTVARAVVKEVQELEIKTIRTGDPCLQFGTVKNLRVEVIDSTDPCQHDWIDITPAEWTSFSHGIISLLKRLIAPDIPHDQLRVWSDLRTCAYVGCPLPSQLLDIERLIYYRSLVTHGPDVLWALIGVETTWLQSVNNALHWLWQQVGPFPERPQPSNDPEFWIHLARHRPGLWRGLIQKTFAKSILQLSIQAEVKVWHGVFADFLDEVGVPLPTSSQQTETATLAQHACLQCRKLFRTRAGWAVHCFRVHGRRATYRYQADGTTCDVCGKLFLNHVRLGDHLRNNPACLEELRNRGLTCPPLPGRNSRAWRRSQPWDQCPYLFSEGPRMSTPPNADDLLPDDLRFLETLIELEDTLDLADHDTSEEHLTQCIRDACFSTHLEIDVIKKHLRSWAAHVAERWFRRRLRPQPMATLHRAILCVEQQAAVQYFLPEEFNLWLTGRPSPEHLDDQARLGALASLPTLDYCPSPRMFPRFRQLIFAHLYSGHRRTGDLQDCIAALDWSPDLPPLVLSLDIVIDAHACNIFDPQIRLRWYNFALAGGLHGLMCGPPCESWSVARERYLRTQEGPRPLRRKHCPWAIDQFTMREGRQLYTANLLMFFSILLVLCQWKSRTWAGLEHPAAT
eukprot:Skav234658  [mRNA]  locus=scaffold1131:216616:224286:- [translate_table: standard]